VRQAAPLVLGLAAALALRFCAAVAEVAFARTPPSRGRARDRILAPAARATTQVAGAAAVGMVTMLVWRHAGRGFVPAVLALVVPLTLVVLDLVPRGLAAEAPARLRRAAERALYPVAVLLAPLLALERGLGRLLMGRSRPGALETLRLLEGWLASRPGRGPLEISEAGLAARIARFASKSARDVMVPLVDVCAVPDVATVGDVVSLMRERGFSRVPVFHERMFNTTGVVSSLDLLDVVDPGLPVTGVVREPLFVPESKALPELLATLRTQGRNLAVVVDEYGGAVGLVTLEDLVEEIVGEIEDEYDAPRELYRRVAPGVFVLSARAPVAEVNERFGWNLPQGEYETLGGLVLERLGRIPKPGDVVQAGRVRIVVTRATTRAVQELRVRERR
jgi:putative hemolysin